MFSCRSYNWRSCAQFRCYTWYGHSFAVGTFFLNFQQGTTCTGDGEVENLSSPNESVSDNQAVRVTDCYTVIRTIHQVYSVRIGFPLTLTLFDYIEHLLLKSQSLVYTDEGESEIPSWCVSNLLREDHTEEPSAAEAEPVSPPAVVGHEVCSSHLNEKNGCRSLRLQIHMGYALR